MPTLHLGIPFRKIGQEGKRESHERSLQDSSRIRPSWLNGQRTRGFPLMAALVSVLMVPVSVGVLVAMRPRLVLVLMPVMAVGTALMGVLVLMLVLVVATHSGRTSFS